MILLKILNEKMKKVLFFMFLLFLGLETASVKAQVRIGGNTAPNASALLDLNATDATNNGTKGLALPRVNLTSNTMQLTTGVTNLTGMLVYNTTTTLGQIGIFYWNGATWVKASLPSTSTADSGKVLMSNGSNWIAAPLSFTVVPGRVDSLWIKSTPVAVSFTRILDTVIVTKMPIQQLHYYNATVVGLTRLDVCYAHVGGTGQLIGGLFVISDTGAMIIIDLFNRNLGAGYSFNVRCYRPSN